MQKCIRAPNKKNFKSIFILSCIVYILIQQIVPIKTLAATTLLTDDFTGSLIDTNKWVESDANGTNVTQNGTLVVTGDNHWHANGLRTSGSYDRSLSDLIIETDITFSNCSPTSGGIIYGPWGGSLVPGTIIFNVFNGAFTLWTFPTPTTVTGVACQNNVPINVVMILKATGGVDVYLNNSLTPNGSLTALQAPTSFTDYPVSLQQYNSSGILTFDNFNLSLDNAPPTSPYAPSGLMAEARDAGANLTWLTPGNGGSPITDYVIEYKQTFEETWNVFNDGVSTIPSTTITGLTNGVSYSLRVSAINSVGTGPASNPTTSVPFVPALILSDNFTGNSFDLSKWIEADSSINGSGGSAGNVLQNGAVAITGNNTTWEDNSLTTVNSFNRQATDLIIEADIKSSNCASGQYVNAISYGDANLSLNPGDTYVTSLYGATVRLWYFHNGSSTSSITNFACTNDTYFHLKLVIIQAGGARLYINGSTTPDATITGGTFTNKKINLESFSSTATTTFDNIELYAGSFAGIAPTASNVSIIGNTAVNSVMSGSYSFSDLNGDTEGNSIYRWLISNTPNGTFLPISGATSITYIPIMSDLNKYLKFEVTPVSTISPTTGQTVLSVASSQIGAPLNYFYHVLSTGQSLSVGVNGAPALSTTQPYSNKMLSGASLIPLIESSVETMSSSLANSTTAKVAGNNYDMIVTMHGASSTAYTGLKKGTAPYNTGIAQVNSAKSAVEALGRTYIVSAVTTIHGESDHLAATTQSQYEANLVAWQNDYQTDIKAITGQVDSIPLFTDQMSSWTGYNNSSSVIPYAQLAASKNNPGKIVLVGPKYFFNYSDAAHLTNTSYRWLGEYYSKVYKKVLIDREEWVPLSPKKVIRSGNVIYVDFTVPEGPIAFDTTIVDLKTNYGFEYADTSTSATISSVEIFDTDTVKVTLNTTPTGASQKLRYAYTGTAGSNPGAHITGSARGNLRDSDVTTSLYGNTLYNWAVHFNEAIVNEITAPMGSISINNGSTSTNNANVTLTINATDVESSVTEMIISENINFTGANYEAYSTSKALELTSSNGIKTVYIKFKDFVGNISSTYSDTITFDNTSPTGSVVINNDDLTTVSLDVTLNINASDNLSAISQIMFSEDSNFTNSVWETYTTNRNFTFGPGEGPRNIYVKFMDSIGNISSTYSDSILKIVYAAVEQNAQAEEEIADTVSVMVVDELENENKQVYLKLKLIDQNGVALSNVTITIPELNLRAVSDSNGIVNLGYVDKNNYDIEIEYKGKKFKKVLGVGSIQDTLIITLDNSDLEQESTTNNLPIVIIGFLIITSALGFTYYISKNR